MRLADIYNLCQISQDFYQFAARSSDNYSLKRLFFQRAQIRRRATLDILTAVSTKPVVEPRAAAAILWYQAVRSDIARFDHPVFLQLLERQEQIQLEMVKKAVKETQDPNVMHTLAQLAAEMIVSREDLLQLQNKHE
ncbi:hypothetical protein ACR0ST_13250 [Aliidiomarina sp. Khilg15.8]